MATITREKSGNVRIWFTGADRKRKGIRIGNVPDNYANRFKDDVEDLLSACITNSSPREETAHWVMGLSADLQDKLAKAGPIEVAEEPESTAPALGEFVDGWIASRKDVKKSSRLVYGRAKKWMVEFYGASAQIDAITAGDADEWNSYLREHLAENTARRMVSVAKAGIQTCGA
ncbi:MAG: hypothetical protein R3C18_26085 [Planctomycetaceae bacterium]